VLASRWSCPDCLEIEWEDREVDLIAHYDTQEIAISASDKPVHLKKHAVAALHKREGWEREFQLKQRDEIQEEREWACKLCREAGNAQYRRRFGETEDMRELGEYDTVKLRSYQLWDTKFLDNPQIWKAKLRRYGISPALSEPVFFLLQGTR
jgi:hypothetical protein